MSGMTLACRIDSTLAVQQQPDRHGMTYISLVLAPMRSILRSSGAPHSNQGLSSSGARCRSYLAGHLMLM